MRSLNADANVFPPKTRKSLGGHRANTPRLRPLCRSRHRLTIRARRDWMQTQIGRCTRAMRALNADANVFPLHLLRAGEDRHLKPKKRSQSSPNVNQGDTTRN